MSKGTNKKTGLTKLEKENIGNVIGGYTIEVFDDGTVEVSGLQRTPRSEIRAVRRGEALAQPFQDVTRRFNNLTRAVLWASRHLLPHERPEPVVRVQPLFPAQDDN